MQSDAVSNKTLRSPRASTDSCDSMRSPTCKRVRGCLSSTGLVPRAQGRSYGGLRNSGSRISRNHVAQNPTLAHFAPVLVDKFGSSLCDGYCNNEGSRHNTFTAEKTADKFSPRQRGRPRRRPYSFGRGLQRTARSISGHSFNPVESPKSDDVDSSEYITDRPRFQKKYKRNIGRAKSVDIDIRAELLAIRRGKMELSGIICLTSNSRARKCLWADDVDEAFFDEDCVDLYKSKGSSPQKQPDKADEPVLHFTEKQLARRQKDIDIGKGTDGYKRYIQRIPRDRRGNLCPKTPDKMAPISRRSWDATIHRWRINLHNWDNPRRGEANRQTNPDVVTPIRVPSVLGVKRTPKRFASPKKPQTPSSPQTPCTPTSSSSSSANGTLGSPPDLGYGTPAAGELRDDLEEEFLLPLNEFPMLPGSKVVQSPIPAAKLSWADAVAEFEQMEQEEENKNAKNTLETLSQSVERQLSLNDST